VFGAEDKPPSGNAAGIKMVHIPAGKFRMGSDLATNPDELKQSKLFTSGDFDEKPVHDVTISHDFYMSETEVTVSQFQRFRMEYQDAGRFSPYVTGVSWDQANAFCEWLSKKEKKHYRLPTEAEWEYAARAGTKGHFSSGNLMPKSGEANAWGLKNMHTDAPEWIFDWYGPYSISAQTDPVGPARGWAKVVRGGGIEGPNGKNSDGYLPYYRRSANRASVAPAYAGLHPIGFRVVEAELPRTPAVPAPIPLHAQFVKQTNSHVTAGPVSARPWFRQRNLLPIPPENVNADVIEAAGIDPAIHGHNHSGGVAVMPNGDVLYISFSSSTSSTEYLPDTSFIATRLRFGADQWDFPSLFYDFADVNDQSALLWNDGGTVRFFGGGIGLTGVPFRMQSTKDSGANWTPPALPLLKGVLGGFSPQPITNAFRTVDNSMYLSSDAVEGESLLWVSHDDGGTWSDTGGRTAGRHTAFVVLKDGSILGLGGKNTDIDGYMPQAISRDGGKSWVVSKTVFPALASNQRPALIRLASGRLFVASDFQNRNGKQPAGYPQHGAFVALSDDDGKTWKIKKVPQALPHEAFTLGHREWWGTPHHGEGTFGYTVAAQGPNGLIHVIASMNHPSQHFEMNEAWILANTDQVSPLPIVGSDAKVTAEEQRFSDGKVQAKWSGAVDSIGRYDLSGPENWFYPDGSKQYSVTWNNGRKTGTETFWGPHGKKEWEWEHRPDGVSVWTQFWPNGNKKHQSSWRDSKCTGAATSFDLSGRTVKSYNFVDGFLKP
jgi:formylglycine-generating enzyme required for sulfatase activity